VTTAGIHVGVVEVVVITGSGEPFLREEQTGIVKRMGLFKAP
jgi:hypothetical protein